MSCVNRSHPEVIRLANNLNITTAEMAAKIALWQDQNNSDEFPNLIELKQDVKTINVYWGYPESGTNTRILSNLAPRKFIWKGKEYGSVEHAYQSNKSGTFDIDTYNAYVKIRGYGKKIRGKRSLEEMKKANSLQLMKDLVIESFKQNPNSEASKKLLEYNNFTHPTNQEIDKAFLDGLKEARLILLGDNKTENKIKKKVEINYGSQVGNILKIEELKPTLNKSQFAPLFLHLIKTASPELTVKMVKGGSFQGLYKSNDEQISIDVQASDFEITLLHEMIHAGVAKAIQAGISNTLNDKQKAVFDNYSKLYKEVEDYILKDDYLSSIFKDLDYATKLQEFASYGLSDPKMRELLASIKTIHEAKPQSAWSKFKEIVKNLLGFTNTYESALDQLLENVLELSTFNKEIVGNVELLQSVNSSESINKVRNSFERKGINVKINPATQEEEDFYTDAAGLKLNRITNSMTGGLSPFKREKYTEEEKVKRQADYEWLNLDPSVKKRTKRYVELYNYQEYIDRLTIDRTIYRLEGKILHTHWENTVSNDPKIADFLALVKAKYIELTGNELFLDWLNLGSISSLQRALGTTRDHIVEYEVPLHDDILKLAGKADMIIDRGNDIFSIVDLKFGKAFNRSNFIPLHYAEKDEAFASSLELAKLQIMWYAFMFKLQNPNAKFDKLIAKHIRSQDDLEFIDDSSYVNPTKYLNMIINFLQDKQYQLDNGWITDGQRSLYDQLLEKHGNEIFLSKNYMTDSYKAIENAQSEIEKNTNRILKSFTEIGALRFNNSEENFYLPGDSESNIATRKFLIKSWQELVEIHAGTEMFTIADDKDMENFIKLAGNMSDVNNPNIKVWQNLYFKYKEEARKETVNVTKKANELFEKAYGKKGGRTDWFSYRDLYSELLTIDKLEGYERERLLTKKDAAFKSLSKEKQDFLNFLNDTYKQIFDDYLNYREHDLQKNTHLSIYNRKIGNKNDQFEYYDGWFPKIMPERLEQEQMYLEQGGFEYVKNKMQNFIKSSLFYWFEDLYDNDNMRDSIVIPLRYLDKSSIVSEKFYSMNMMKGLDVFVSHVNYKKRMDPLYTAGRAIAIMYKNKYKLEDGNIIPTPYNNTADFMQAHLDIIIRNAKKGFLDELVNNPITYGDKKISLSKGVKELSSSFSKGMMAFRVIQPLGGGLQARLLQHKEAWLDHFSEKYLGMESMSYSVLEGIGIKAEKEAMASMSDVVQNKEDQNKLWMIAQSMNMIPSFDIIKNQATTKLAGQRLEGMDEQLVTAGYSVGETTLALTVLAAQLMTIKNKDGKSLYELYEIENGELVWKGGVRGKRSIGKNEYERYENIEGLTEEEKAKIRKLHSRIQGNYRKEEKTFLDRYVEGQALFQMKRYIVTLLFESFQPKRQVYDLGSWVPISKTPEGEDVYEWHARMVKGRLTTFFSGAVWVYAKLTNNEKMIEGLKFDNLDKRNLMDAGITITMVLASFLTYMLLFKDDDDDEPLKKAWKYYLIDNLGQQYNVYDMLDSTKKLAVPIVLEKSYDVVTGFFTMMYAVWGDVLFDENMMNKEGHIKGADKLLRGIPLTSPFWDYYKKFEKMDSVH